MLLWVCAWCNKLLAIRKTNMLGPWIMNTHHFVLGIFGKWKVGLSHRIPINSNIGHKGKLNLEICCCSLDQNTEGNLEMVKEIRDMYVKQTFL